jgi:hypothetical protein
MAKAIKTEKPMKQSLPNVKHHARNQINIDKPGFRG